MRLKNLKSLETLTANEIVKKVFGDEPFEVSLVRSKPSPDNGDGTAWRWDVSMKLASRSLVQEFVALITTCIHVQDDGLPAKLTIKANKTNAGDEIGFVFENAFFQKRGMRRLRKNFVQANTAWKEAKEVVAWAWSHGDLSLEVVKQVGLIALSDPTMANRLHIATRRLNKCPNCKGYHELDESVLLSMFGGNSATPGVIVYNDKDSTLSKSPFGTAVIDKLTYVLSDIVKTAMVEFMTASVTSVLQQVPAEMMRVLKGLSGSVRTMKAMGMDIGVDPKMVTLMEFLDQHMRSMNEPAKPATKADAKATDDVAGASSQTKTGGDGATIATTTGNASGATPSSPEVPAPHNGGATSGVEAGAPPN